MLFFLLYAIVCLKASVSFHVVEKSPLLAAHCVVDMYCAVLHLCAIATSNIHNLTAAVFLTEKKKYKSENILKANVLFVFTLPFLNSV